MNSSTSNDEVYTRCPRASRSDATLVDVVLGPTGTDDCGKAELNAPSREKFGTFSAQPIGDAEADEPNKLHVSLDSGDTPLTSGNKRTLFAH